MSERWKCDRQGGMNRARYMRRQPWLCARCGEWQDFAGHRCQYCHQRVCCECFHHEEAVCLTAGSDTSERDCTFPQVSLCPQVYPN